MHHWVRGSMLTAVLVLSLGISGLFDAGWADTTEEEKNEIRMFQSETPVSPAEKRAGLSVAYMVEEAEGAAGQDEADQDPWEPFNDAMFSFNRNVFDRFLLRPVSVVWDTVLPDPVQRSLSNAFDNLAVVRRLVNNVFQLKMEGAGREVARFTINSTIGVAGLFDVAKDGFGIQQSDEDTGQTMGVYGIGPGPYLILPFLPPLTVRDGIGLAADGAMNPLNYFIPFAATAGMYGTNAVNERSLNLDKFERVEETVVDLYSAVRNAYLQRRAAAIKE